MKGIQHKQWQVTHAKDTIRKAALAVGVVFAATAIIVLVINSLA